MISLSGYKVLSLIYSGKSTSVYRGIWLEKNLPVILKVLNDEYPLQEDISRLKHEYNLIQDLALPGVVRAYQLDKIEHRFALVLEDIPDSMTLSDFIKIQKVSLDLFLPLALQITRILQQLHEVHIIHKDLNPNNIIIAKNNQIKLIDFSIATQLSQESQEITSPEALEGTLPYMSPEQTARMNRVVDRRTDLYSLGIIFYQLLTGQLPFEAQDALEWVYCHIAKRPKPPNELNSKIPQVIADMVMKLLAKSPEDRYSTAYGLAADLEHATTSWQRQGKVSAFPLGEKDRTSLFQIPQKLYGREIEVELLLNAFAKARQGIRELLLVYGYAGIGKTSLISEVHKPVIRQHGYFASGKFEQFQQGIPYYGLIQAFRSLIKQLLAENKKRLDYWREALLKILSPNGQVIIEVIPEVEWLIGKQPTVVKLPSTEAQARFELVFFDFVQTFCQADHPLVIFLDDLQWADFASLSLIKKILKDEQLKYLLVIGAYRENEVKVGHPLLELIDDLTKLNVPLEKLQLKPLSFRSIKQLVIDTLNTQVEIEPLAQLIFEKTGGNPFFCNMFLTMLHKENYLTFDTQQAQWTWDISALKALTITDNVVDLLISKIEKLPENTQALLKIAACIGNEFDLKALAIVSEVSLAEAAQALWPALQENLIVPLSEAYRLIMADPDYAADKESIAYKFSHDHIQQASNAMLAAEQNKLTHLKIGRLLLTNLSAEELEDKVFKVVNHFNSCLDLITNTEEKFTIAKFNIRAGNKAKLSVAYQAAADYFGYAIRLLGETAWQMYYPEAFEANLGYAEHMHLLGRFVESEVQFEELIKRASTRLDKARILMFQTMSYSVQSEQKKSVAAGIKGLQILGIQVKSNVGAWGVLVELFKTKWALHKIKLENILDRLPQLTDPEKVLVLYFFEQIAVAAYYTNLNLVASLSLMGVRYSLNNGYCAASAISFLVYGMIIGSGFHNYKRSLEIASLGLQMVEKFDDVRVKVRAYVIVNTVLFPWVRPYRECLPSLNQAYSLGRQLGELLYSGYAAILIPSMMFFQGEELQDIVTKLNDVSNVLEFTGYSDGLRSSRFFLKLLLILQGNKPFDYMNDEINLCLSNEFYATKVPGGSIGILCITCLMGAYLLEEWDAALKLVKVTWESTKLEEMASLYFLPECYFFVSLVLLSIYPKANIKQKLYHRHKIKTSLRRLKKWAASCPANFEAKYQLILGGWLFISGKRKKAAIAFDKSIKLAREHGLTLIEGIANEFIGRLYQSKNLFKYAKLFMQEAALVYQRWGFVAKISKLEDKYGGFFGENVPTTSKKNNHKIYNNRRQINNSYQIWIRSVICNEVSTNYFWKCAARRFNSFFC